MRLPMRVEPVAEIRGSRGSRTIGSPTSLTEPMAMLNTPGHSYSCITRSQILCTAMAHSGTLCDGFHTVGSPHTAAMAAFHAHTATGKLKAVITPTGPI